MTPEQKEYVKDLLLMGDQLEAVRYLQQTLGINADQALMLAEKLEEEEKGEDPDLREQFNAMKAEMGEPGKTKVPSLVGKIFMSLGLVMLAIMAYLIVSMYQFAERAISVTGKVISYDMYYSTNDNGGSTAMYSPIFEFSFNGVTRTYKSNTSTSSRDLAIGDPVEILVDPDDPQSIQVNTFWEQWLVPGILGFLGLMFTGVGYIAYRVF